MISVLIPVNNIYRAIDTINSITQNSDILDVILRFKDTDTDSLSRIEELPMGRYIIGKDHGLNVHEDINELCEAAIGDILMPMNERTEIFTPGWSSIIVDEISIVHLGNLGVCPGITRKLYDILGHYALHSDYLSYITNVGIAAGINKTVPVQVRTSDGEVSNEYDFRSRGIQTLINLDAGRINGKIKNNITTA